MFRTLGSLLSRRTGLPPTTAAVLECRTTTTTTAPLTQRSSSASASSSRLVASTTTTGICACGSSRSLLGTGGACTHNQVRAFSHTAPDLGKKDKKKGSSKKKEKESLEQTVKDSDLLAVITGEREVAEHSAQQQWDQASKKQQQERQREIEELADTDFSMKSLRMATGTHEVTLDDIEPLGVTYTCPFCPPENPVRFDADDTVSDVRSHIGQVHSRDIVAKKQCPKCAAPVSSSEVFLDHLDYTQSRVPCREIGLEELECPYCVLDKAARDEALDRDLDILPQHAQATNIHIFSAKDSPLSLERHVLDHHWKPRKLLAKEAANPKRGGLKGDGLVHCEHCDAAINNFPDYLTHMGWNVEWSKGREGNMENDGNPIAQFEADKPPPESPAEMIARLKAGKPDPRQPGKMYTTELYCRAAEKPSRLSISEMQKKWLDEQYEEERLERESRDEQRKERLGLNRKLDEALQEDEEEGGGVMSAGDVQDPYLSEDWQPADADDLDETEDTTQQLQISDGSSATTQREKNSGVAPSSAVAMVEEEDPFETMRKIKEKQQQDLEQSDDYYDAEQSPQRPVDDAFFDREGDQDWQQQQPQAQTQEAEYQEEGWQTTAEDRSVKEDVTRHFSSGDDLEQEILAELEGWKPVTNEAPNAPPRDADPSFNNVDPEVAEAMARALGGQQQHNQPGADADDDGEVNPLAPPRKGTASYKKQEETITAPLVDISASSPSVGEQAHHTRKGMDFFAPAPQQQQTQQAPPLQQEIQREHPEGPEYEYDLLDYEKEMVTQTQITTSKTPLLGKEKQKVTITKVKVSLPLAQEVQCPMCTMKFSPSAGDTRDHVLNHMKKIHWLLPLALSNELAAAEMAKGRTEKLVLARPEPLSCTCRRRSFTNFKCFLTHLNWDQGRLACQEHMHPQQQSLAWQQGNVQKQQQHPQPQPPQHRQGTPQTASHPQASSIVTPASFARKQPSTSTTPKVKRAKKSKKIEVGAVGFDGW